MKILIALASLFALAALAGCGGGSTTAPATATAPVTGPTGSVQTTSEKPTPAPKKGPTVTIPPTLMDNALRRSQCVQQVIPPGARPGHSAQKRKALANCMSTFNTSAKQVAFCVKSQKSVAKDAFVDSGWNFGFCLGQFYKFADRVEVCTHAAPLYSKPSTRAHLISRCAEGFRVMYISLQANSKKVG